ncbi:MAG: DHH family phosphoesterase [Phycisphaerae bacterium]|jgi:phosphoesterase RecJ-like protein|nr:DHH family phosphoesterase [Phycisphaerae bacterium]
MSEAAYESNVTIARLAERIRSAKHILVTTHAKPDGDALGSVLAIVRASESLGKRVEGWIVGPFEPNLMSLAKPTALVMVDQKRPVLPTVEPDLIVIVDTGAWNQLETLAPWLRDRTDRAIGIDHHARGDLVAAERVIDVQAGAAAVIVAELVRELGVPFAQGGNANGWGSVAEAIFLGLATDTGWFRFQNARPREFALASELLAAGVDKDRLIEITENGHRPQRLAIEARALAKVRFLLDGQFALASLSLADFAETGAVVEETSGVVNMPMAVGSVRAAALLIESEPGLVKISFRSKPRVGGDNAPRFFDVNRLAATFGGGGHVHAAGARIRAPLAEAERAVIAALPTA